jgi:hypothetical protein
MMTTETRGKQDILILDSNHVPRPTVTWRVRNGAHMRFLIKAHLDVGDRVACFSETVREAEKLCEWVTKLYGGDKRALSLTKKVNDAMQERPRPLARHERRPVLCWL